MTTTKAQQASSSRPAAAVPPSVLLADDLRRQILDGVLTGESRLPSVRALASEIGVANGTVVEAYRILAADGLIHSNMLGTFVKNDASIIAARKRKLETLATETVTTLLRMGYHEHEIRAAFLKVGRKK